MNAKEKTNELIEKYLKLDIEIGGQYDGYLTMKMHDAKQCALIAVEEIMSAIDAEDHVILYNYWQKVRAELQSL